MPDEDRFYDMFARLFERVEGISRDLNKLLGKYEERDKVCDRHESRLTALEIVVQQWTGARAIAAWFVTTSIAVAGLVISLRK